MGTLFNNARMTWQRLLLVAAVFALDVIASAGAAEPHVAAPDDFLGIWTGEITAPNATTRIGLNFLRSEKGISVRMDFPEMFLHNVNFGPAQIEQGTLRFPPFNLCLAIQGDELRGTFGLAGLPVQLRRGGEFSTAPLAPNLPPAPRPLWTTSLGAPAWASPTAYDGFVYVATIDGVVHAVRATDGTEIWKWSGPHPCYGAALVTSTSLYLVDEQFDLVALRRDDGALEWRIALYDKSLSGRAPPADETFNHRTTTPVLDQHGNLYVGSADGNVYSVRADTGAIRWRIVAGTKIFAPLTLVADRLVVPGFNGDLITYDVQTQAQLSRVKLGGPLVSQPIIVGDRVVIGARDYMLYGIDAPSGTLAWRNSFWFSWVESTPTLADGLLYVGGSDYRRISVLEPTSGRVVWATDVFGLSWGSPAVTDTTVFAGTCGQTIAGTVIKHTGGIVALDRANGHVRWRYSCPEISGAKFIGFAGSLVVVDGRVIGAGLDGVLVAFSAN
ncbi:MAG: PQQ-binding-like beta-propeller repeat protein [Opitutus sp.]